MVHAQLHLLQPVERPWQLDDTTVRIGRAGLARARAALTATASGTRSSASADDHGLAA